MTPSEEIAASAGIQPLEISNLKADLGDWLERAKKHPSLRAARAQLAAAQEKIRSIRAEGLPTLDASVSYYQNGRPNQGLSANQSQQTIASLTLNIPVFEGFGRTYKERGAQAQTEQRSAELQDKEGQISMEVVKAHADAVASLENLGASLNLQLLAEQAAVSMQRRYERGAGDILEVINTQTTLADARQERIKCLADWQSSRLRLLASVGGMGRESVGLR